VALCGGEWQEPDPISKCFTDRKLLMVLFSVMVYCTVLYFLGRVRSARRTLRLSPWWPSVAGSGRSRTPSPSASQMESSSRGRPGPRTPEFIAHIMAALGTTVTI